MPHNVDIKTFFIAKSKIDGSEVDNWMQYLKANEFDLNLKEKTDAEGLIELAGRRCYMSFQPGLNKNVTKIRNDIVEYIDNIMKSAHGSVLEHYTYTFAIEGVSRVFTGEMNRHRAGWAISEGSMRYIRFDDIGWWMPTSMIVLDTDDEEVKNAKLETQKIFHNAFAQMEENYNKLLKIWDLDGNNFHYKKTMTSMFRRIIGMGVATGGVWTGNLRAIRHVLTMRTTSAAEEEICYVFSEIMKKIKDIEPSFFGDFTQDEFGFWSPKYKKI